MALQTSGEISLFDIRDEFGQSNPVNLLDYYRGGGIVPDVDANSNVPTSGAISIQDFYGAMNLSPFTVYSGSASAPNEYNEITLPTPVPVGESFIMVSCTGVSQPRRTIGQWTLIDSSGGNWTKMSVEFENAHTDRVAEWQVITCPDFNVQQIKTTVSGTSTDVSISSIDTSKSFVYHTNQHLPRIGESSWRSRFTSSTNVRFEGSSNNDSRGATLFVIEWEGATVRRGTTSMTGTSTSPTHTSVDLSKSFVLFSFYTDNTEVPEASDIATRCRQTNSTTVEFTRTTSNFTMWYSYEVIEHPLISVQRSSSTSAFTDTNFSISSVDTSKSFLAVNPTLGNASLTGTGEQELSHNRHYFTSSTNVRVSRFLTNGRDLNIHIQAVSS